MKDNMAMRRLSARAAGKIAVVIFLLTVAAFFSYGRVSSKQSGVRFASYRDIPGVTDDEIRDIEALRGKTPHFVYGMLSTTETFAGDNGEIGGFAALFCEWLSRLFGIPFKPAIYDWGDLVAGLKSHKIDFTGEMTPTDERRKTYFMTDPIAERLIKTFRLADSKPILEIIQSRPLRSCFLEGTTTIQEVISRLQGKYEIILVNDYNSAYQTLKRGEADAYFEENTAEAAFDVYGDVLAEDFLPIIYSSVSMTTGNPDLRSIISVVQKALQSGSIGYLTDLYNMGENEHKRHVLSMRLSAEERAYIREHPVISLAAEYDNYPISFYNKYEKKWQGIAHDVLRELEALTGLAFKIANNKNTEWPELLGLLERGEVSMITELLRSTERDGVFLWPQTAIMADHYALISKSDYPRIQVNDILSVSVGLIKNTAYASLFRSWFPNHNNVVEYENTNTAFDALERGKVDIVMANLSQLLMLTNYYERAGYKANIVFDFALESAFGFNKDEAVLCSIVDKALCLIDTKGISGQWMRKTYDYSAKIARMHRFWLISAAALLLSVLVLLLVLFQKNRRIGKRLETLVQQRTNELVIQSATINAAFDATPDMVFCKDLDSRFTRCNKTFEKYFNVREDDIIGKGDVDGLGIPPDLAERYGESDRKILSEGRIVVIEEYIPAADGSSQLFETSKVPLVQNGQTTGLLVISHNITQRKAMEEQALSASRAKSAFLSNMSHEMRTPLNAITGMTVIGRNAKDMERKDYALDKIGDASTHLLGVISDVLDMSKIEANMLKLSPIEFNFEKMLQRVIAVINFRVDEKRQKLAVRLDNAIPRTLVADDQRLSQVIANLLSNAVKFTPEEGDITLAASFIGEENGLCTIQVSVSDTGIGINEEQQRNLFTSFQQAESSTTRKYGGTGLGLAISKSIVEMMGGKIGIRSELGKGSVFTFTVHAKKGSCAKEEPDAGDVTDKEEPDITGLFAGRRVLLVEDVEINREIVLALLEPTQLQIDCAENGVEAVRKFAAAPEAYGLIFMDVQMPEMDGYEATRRIRAMDIPKAKAIPIIAMTANVFKEDIEKCEAAGMDGHIGKPLDIEEVMSKLRRYLPAKN
ncbi:MAG: transporter substrate-binding domain-containing protein [Chitinispirillales bacterium]|jgi:PAS domain S-box-containing protein|nr:transporter substrate-binding domain-containing protein [Chitinispirillales bacterium]